MGDEAAFAESDRQLGVISDGAEDNWESSEGERRTLDLPEPESPRDTILAM